MEYNQEFIQAFIILLEKDIDTVFNLEQKSSNFKQDIIAASRAPSPISQITEMGFTPSQAQAALEMSEDNVQQALSLLLEDNERVESFIRSRSLKKSISLNNLKKSNSLEGLRQRVGSAD